MLFKERSITFREFAMNEPAPLSLIQEAVLEFLQNRDDAVVFGAQAVNAYVDEPRMSQDVDILALDADGLAEALRVFLGDRFHIAVRVRSVASDKGLRIDQVRKPKNRHLIDIRRVTELPPTRRVAQILVPTPEQLISQKLVSMVGRSKTAKGMTDIADLRRLLLFFPELKSRQGPVSEALHAANADPSVLAAWQDMVLQDIRPDDNDEY